MGIALRLAWRNLWRHRRRTALTASAVAFSAALLVFMISIQLGAYDMILDITLRVFPGHVQVQHPAYLDQPQIRSIVPNAEPLAERLRANLDNAGVAVRAYAFALASSNTRSYGVQVVGLQPQFEPNVSTIPRLIAKGRYFSDAHAQELILGETLARNLRVKLGDELTLLGAGKDGSMAATVLPVVGIFNSGSPDIDRGMVQMPLAAFQEVFSMGNDAHAIVITARSLKQLAAVIATARALLPPNAPLSVRPWQKFLPGLEQLIQADQISSWFTYVSLIVVVTFSILNTFLMAVLERTREFGIMLALGAKPLRIGGLVVLESLLLTVLGLGLGLIIGGAVSYYFYVNGFTFPGLKEIHAHYGLPGVVHPQISFITMLLGPAVILFFTTLASIYPALRIRRLQPVEAIHAV